MGWGLVLIGIIGIVWYLLKPDSESDRQEGESSVVDSNVVHGAVQFLSSYISLCKKHSVVGHAYIHRGESNDYGYKVEGDCIIFTIDNEHAVDSLWYVTAEQDRALSELNKSYEAYKTVIDQLEERIRGYFGTDSPHYVFIDPDEYHFNDPDITFHYEGQFFAVLGYKWAPTLDAIENELLNKFPNVQIKMGKYGISID